MRHVILTCKNHPNLRWSTKATACNDGGKPGDPAYYNHSRNICFCGEPTGNGMFHDMSGLDCSTFIETRNDEGQVTSSRIVHECPCPPSDLIIAPEDPLVRRDS